MMVGRSGGFFDDCRRLGHRFSGVAPGDQKQTSPKDADKKNHVTKHGAEHTGAGAKNQADFDDFSDA
jgi:hypothetical protein